MAVAPPPVKGVSTLVPSNSRRLRYVMHSVSPYPSCRRRASGTACRVLIGMSGASHVPAVLPYTETKAPSVGPFAVRSAFVFFQKLRFRPVFTGQGFSQCRGRTAMPYFSLLAPASGKAAFRRETLPFTSMVRSGSGSLPLPYWPFSCSARGGLSPWPELCAFLL